MPTTRIIPAAFAAAVALLASGAARAYVRSSTSNASGCPSGSNAPLEWKRGPVRWVLDSGGTPDAPSFSSLQDSASRPFQTWQDVSCSDMAFAFDGSKSVQIGYSGTGTNTNAVKFIESGWSHDSRALAITLTTFTCSTGEIADSDIIFNGEHFRFTTDPLLQPTRIDIENTLTHEVGHMIGFDHSPDLDSTMYGDAFAGETKKRTLTADDEKGACDVYPPGWLSSAGGGTGNTGGDTSAAKEEGGCATSGIAPGALALLAAFALRRGRRAARGRGVSRSGAGDAR